jgi:hypothetical protein
MIRMIQPPFFDLHLHDDAELAALLGSPLVERTTLHKWPLSCVQRIRTADGRSRIYKVQAPPTSNRSSMRAPGHHFW